MERICGATVISLSREQFDHLPALYQFQLPGELQREAAGSDILVPLIKARVHSRFSRAFSATYFEGPVLRNAFSGTGFKEPGRRCLRTKD
jgi:hypothetical protein